MFVVGCLKPNRQAYDIQCAKYNRCKNTIISFCYLLLYLNVNSKLSINVTCNKARLKYLSSAFDHSNGHEIKWLYSPRVGGKIVCHNLSNRRIPFNLSSKQKLVYALRKRFLKQPMKIYGFESLILLLWRPTFNLKSGVLASATWPRERHDMRSMYIVPLMTSGKRSWPQERLVLKLSINRNTNV